MISANTSVYTDLAGLGALKAKAAGNKDAAVREVAAQFEGLFVQMMLKSMRDAGASFESGLFNSDQTKFYQEMFDQQLSLDLSQQAGGIGLAAVLERQLSPQGQLVQGGPGRDVADYLARPVAGQRPLPQAVQSSVSVPAPAPAAVSGPAPAPESFLQRMRPAAQKAAAELGVPAEALLAQAALESGWGEHMMRHDDGRNSFNLFGIKADQRWPGERVEVVTTEYREGVPLKTSAEFRAYGSYEESFMDYAAFIKGNPRYRKALAVAADPQSYVNELQAAGYATDPRYANKIIGILQRLAAQDGQQQLAAAAHVAQG